MHLLSYKNTHNLCMYMYAFKKTMHMTQSNTVPQKDAFFFKLQIQGPYYQLTFSVSSSKLIIHLYKHNCFVCNHDCIITMKLTLIARKQKKNIEIWHKLTKNWIYTKQQAILFKKDIRVFLKSACWCLMTCCSVPCHLYSHGLNVEWKNQWFYAWQDNNSHSVRSILSNLEPSLKCKWSCICRRNKIYGNCV